MTNILDCIASDEVALGVLQREFDDTIGYQTTLNQLESYATYSKQSIARHIQDNRDFYIKLGASIIQRRVKYSYVLNPKSTLIVIANFNATFRRKVNFTSIAHITEKLFTPDVKPIESKVQQPPDTLIELERRFKEEKQQLLHQIKEYGDTNIKLHNQILELQQQIDKNKRSIQFANEKVDYITTHIEALLKIQNYHFDTDKPE